MNQLQASSTAIPEGVVVGRSRWTGGRITALVTGVLVGLFALVLLGAGGTGVWADLTQRDGDYVTTDTHAFSTAGSALATESTKLGTSGIGWLYAPGLLDRVRIRVTPASPGTALFVGIGPTTEVDRYLAGVNHTLISDFWDDKVETVGGGAAAAAPATQDFWVASATGAGAETLIWKAKQGSWTVVVMNADGRAGVDVEADLGARLPAIVWIALGLLVGGAVFMTGGVLLIVGAIRRTPTVSGTQGGIMSTPSVTVPMAHAPADRVEEADRYLAVKQYSLTQIVAVWGATALPMAILAWVVAPAIKDSFAGTGNVPMIKALLVLLTAGMIWQCVLVAALVWFEQRSLRWSTLREALWLRSPRSPRSGRVGGKLWLLLIPLSLLFAVEEFLPQFGVPGNRDLAKFLDSDAGHSFMSGNWGWFALIMVMFLFNTVLGEELLFRGLLLPRMKAAFGRRDWAANGVLFAAYHVHVPWMMPATVLVDTFAIAYPARRYQSAWIGIAVHSVQSVFLAVVLLALVL